MARTNFSTEEAKVLDLINDLSRGDFSLHVDKEKVGRKELEDYARQKINDEILKGKTLYQAYRANKMVIFEIVEEIVNLTISNDFKDIPFIDNFVEFKNRYLGDESLFYSEGKSYLSVVSFAGNHWDTNRESLDAGETFTLPREWVYVRAYDEFERFLLNITSLERLTDVIYKSFNKYLKERIYMQFQNIMSTVPTEFSAKGNDEEALGNLCDLVQAAGQYSNVTIAGTQGALRKLANIVPDKYFANSQREAKANTGNIKEWEGKTLMPIPQVLKQGTFELALDNDVVFILGGDVKPIKVEFVGDTRTKEIDDNKINNDMTLDVQVQTAFGIGLMLPEAFGCFQFA